MILNVDRLHFKMFR